jgi:hypothetical protein
MCQKIGPTINGLKVSQLGFCGVLSRDGCGLAFADGVALASGSMHSVWFSDYPLDVSTQ